jgi:hypothetical protein
VADFYSEGISKAVYTNDKFLNRFGDYLEKEREVVVLRLMK